MSEKVTCECGRWVFDGTFWGLPIGEEWSEQSLSGYCLGCEQRLSVDPDGKPVAEAMVPRAALEVALQQMAVVEVTCDVGPATDFPLTPDELAQEVADYVAAAEEARDDETSG